MLDKNSKVKIKEEDLQMKEWRLILDEPKSGYENMAIDEAVLIGCENGLSPSTVRFYDWDEPTLSIGCFQRIGNYQENCMPLGIPVVRRITGGRAVLHDMELTYSIVTDDAALFEKGIIGAYKILSNCIIAAIGDMGIDACIQKSDAGYQKSDACFKSASRYEILVNGKKIAGSAQKRLKRAFLQHGSIIMDVNKERFSSIFGIDDGFLTDGLGSYIDMDKDILLKSILKRLEHGIYIKLTSDGLSRYEMDLKDRLIEQKYSNIEWNN